MEESDKKKMLSLPFYLQKRSELPQPKYGQREWNLFKDMFGVNWNHYD